MDLREACAIYEWTNNEWHMSSKSADAFIQLMGDQSYKDAIGTLSSYSLSIVLAIAVVALLLIWFLGTYTKMNKIWLAIATVLLFGLVLVDVGNFYQIASRKALWFSPLLKQMSSQSFICFGISCILSLIWIFIKKKSPI